jgi:uncharacterized membrane protein YraQ (UPF0718 family)
MLYMGVVHGYKTKASELTETLGKSLEDIGKLVVGGVVIGGVVNGAFEPSQLITGGSIIAFILILIGVWISTSDKKKE